MRVEVGVAGFRVRVSGFGFPGSGVGFQVGFQVRGWLMDRVKGSGLKGFGSRARVKGEGLGLGFGFWV